MTRRLRDWLAAAVLAAALIAAVIYLPGEDLDGNPSVIDGDSLRFDGREIRLFGIDAPEGRQTCERGDGAPWPCGREATALLKRLVSGSAVACRGRDEDRYRRLVATCTAGDTDLAAEMVRRGMALAYRSHSRTYVDEETEARDARRGLWSGRFDKPWEWRERHSGR